jgi:hypothetical protein
MFFLIEERIQGSSSRRSKHSFQFPNPLHSSGVVVTDFLGIWFPWLRTRFAEAKIEEVTQ